MKGGRHFGVALVPFNQSAEESMLLVP